MTINDWLHLDIAGIIATNIIATDVRSFVKTIANIDPTKWVSLGRVGISTPDEKTKLVAFESFHSHIVKLVTSAFNTYIPVFS
jgi:hypothetical protein